ncbi:DEAD/DEAH box helicase [Rhodococcus sp. SBT000017]|uniref:DEAD/DEAH box helicase n=1 Tax=Rhodococcus sp. SBT000017 TaxID=1803385 RepID=UPI000EF8BD53|nr:DEAD/DEAH box helicase [Rhodococcus sp. SBT000017]RMB78674.1 DEAD/DEAH box helicase [Rhodococcus sp. SBT000017]
MLSTADTDSAPHVTYLPHRHCFAVWHSTPGATPVGESTPVELAVPGADGTIAVRTVGAHLVAANPGELRSATSSAEGPSARGWLAILNHVEQNPDVSGLPSALVDALPPAAHAVPNAGGSSVSTAHGAADALRASLHLQNHLLQRASAFTPRPYQVHGAAWIPTVHEVGGGGILADEMGLGKTLQAIAHMIVGARRGEGNYLVVCPTSLISNWRREIENFSDGELVVNVYRGPSRTLELCADAGSVTVTGYPTLRTDTDRLSEISWSTVFFDEAHVMKNSRTKIARAARRLNSTTRIALTGTPVENRMDELWALIDLTNPGLLGTRARFTRRFSAPIEQGGSAAALAQLSSAIAPVVLRRTKAEVATDLPPKNHIDVLCPISNEQAMLYNSAIEEAFDTGFGTDRGRGTAVLALLTQLKLICNHPGLVNGDLARLADRSGKLDRLTDIVEELAESSRAALVFTQYRRTGEILAEHLERLTGAPIPFFHGGLDVDKRDKMVDRFQNSDRSPVMVLSLRAAGYGLNLTRASTVIHYDRWWNPAVEAQATDRVHRIGQKSQVTVMALTTEGTLEEHIASLHTRKKAIAGLTESNNELALAALDDSTLRETLSLRAVSR